MPVWGKSPDGQEVHLITLRSPTLEVDVTSFGATLVAVRVKVGGSWLDVLLGYESLERYTNGGKPNFASIVGRCANRVAGALFELDGQLYELDRNNGKHHLHGGMQGFWQRTFEVLSSSDTSVTLRLVEPDRTMGYPGTVEVKVTYEVRGSELHFMYEGVTDKPTLMNLTNHGYWNLKGQHAGDALDHEVMLVASHITAVDESLAPSGELTAVAGTPLDFTGAPKSLREAVDKFGPIDCNFCVDRPPEEKEGAARTPTLAAKLIGPNGVTMDVYTDQPGLQLFTAHNIANPANPPGWWHGKGVEWQKFGAVCLEPQLWPDAVHHAHFPSAVLRPGETYRQHSYHVFGAPAA